MSCELDSIGCVVHTNSCIVVQAVLFMMLRLDYENIMWAYPFTSTIMAHSYTYEFKIALQEELMIPE